MAHRFDPCRMERLRDGTVKIGITIVPTVDGTGEEDKAVGTSTQWATCSAAHQHGWSVCDLRALFRARELGEGGRPLAGTSPMERLESWLNQRRIDIMAPSGEIPLPTRKVQVDGKEVDEPIRDLAL